METIMYKYEIGEIFKVNDFFFLLTGEAHRYYTGYKIASSVSLATSKDFVFTFNDQQFFAILEHELYIPKGYHMFFIGKLSEEYINILYDYEINNTPIPPPYSGRADLQSKTDTTYSLFRHKEMKDVRYFIANIFLLFEEE